MRDGQAIVFFALGGNFAVATPDTPATQAALRRCVLTAQVSTTFNRSHLVHGTEAWILPCLGRTERDVQHGGAAQAITVEDSMSMVHRSAGRNEPASPQLLSEPVIVARLAQATLAGTRTPWAWLVEDYSRIRDKIAAVIPGFENFNDRVAVPGGFRLPNAAAERRWNTANGKAIFAAHPLEPRKHGDGVLTLATIRSHDQYNTTVYGTRDRYRGVQGERRVVFISREDLHRLGLKAGERVDIETVADDSVVRRVQGFLLVEYAIPPGNIASYYPETNPLVPLHAVAEGAGTPASKSIPVRLQRPDRAVA
jgi:molybdopterin-dependent oxidoreductase alpha subunit